jgi:hypothetical protein
MSARWQGTANDQRYTKLLLKFFTDFSQATVALIAADSDKEFTIGQKYPKRVL